MIFQPRLSIDDVYDLYTAFLHEVPINPEFVVDFVDGLYGDVSSKFLPQTIHFLNRVPGASRPKIIAAVNLKEFQFLMFVYTLPDHCVIVPGHNIPKLKEVGLHITPRIIRGNSVHFDIEISPKLTRASSKRINRIHPPTSLIDSNHSVCHIGDIIYHMLHGQWVHRCVSTKLMTEWDLTKSVKYVNLILSK